MKDYSYKAINQNGLTVTGNIKGDSYSNVLEELESSGLQPFYLDKNTKEKNSDIESKRNSSKNFSLSVNKYNSALLFTKQLANLLKAGIQLDEALDIIINLFKDSPFKNIIINVTESLKGGQSFANSLKDYPGYFNNTYITMIKAGEESGYLPLVCKRIVDDMEENQQLRSHIISSMIYPIILVLFSLLAVLIVLLYILPKFIGIYDSYDQSLPLPTIFLLNISTFISQNGLIIILSIFLLLAFYLFYSRTESGKDTLDNFILKLPIIGNLLSKLSISRITNGLGILVNNGVPLLKSLKIIRDVTGNAVYNKAMQKIAQKVERGSPLSKAMDSTGIFPDITIYLVGVGERTGELGVMLNEVGGDLSQEYREGLDRTLKFIEPFILLFMGLIIAFLVFAMLLPVMRINTIM